MMNNKINKRVALTLNESEWAYIESYLDTGRIGTNLAQLIRDHIKLDTHPDRQDIRDHIKHDKKNNGKK